MSIYRLDYPLDDVDPLIMPSVNPEDSCIYIFFIDGKGCYVGKSDGKKPKKRWQRDYSKNVRDMLDGKPWHNDPTKDFRKIHSALHKAVKEKLRITLIIYENLTGKALTDREDELIDTIGTLNGRRTKPFKKGRGKEPNKNLESIIGAVDAANKLAKGVETLIDQGKRRGASGKSRNFRPNDWLDYKVEAIINVANPFKQNTKRWKRHRLLLEYKKSLAIREYSRLLVEARLPRVSKKYFRAALKHKCIRIFDKNGRVLTKNILLNFLK